MTPRSNGRRAATARGGLAALSAIAAALSIYGVCPALAAAPDPRFQTNLEATVRYLQDSQQENGGFAEAGGKPGPEFSAWVALALAAAGVNPRDQTTARQHWVGGHSAYTYLAEHAREEASAGSVTTNFERELLVVDAAGSSPREFGGVDLVGEILKRQIASGANAGAFWHEAGFQEPGVNDTIFAILSLSPIHEPAVEEAVARATRWLEAQQKCDGSWYWQYTARFAPCNQRERRLLPGEERGEIDMTGAALEALNAVEHPGPQGQDRAFDFLKEAEDEKGGFPEFLGEKEPNVASTAWVVQAMWSAGINPETWTTGKGPPSEEPLSYLASMQQEDGHIRYEKGQELNGMWMTAYVTPAFAGDPLPIPEAPYEPLPARPPEEAVGGDGGVSTNAGSGVIAGGGGERAPLFSRPQPDSKGHTPGAVRLLSSSREHTTRRDRNPGRPRKTPAPTATQAPAPDADYKGPGLELAATGPGSSKAGVGSPTSATGRGGQEAGQEVNGVLIGAPAIADMRDALEPGAPGLHGAQAGDNRSPWLAIAIGGVIALLVIAGSQLERRRPQAIL